MKPSDLKLKLKQLEITQKNLQEQLAINDTNKSLKIDL